MKFSPNQPLCLSREVVSRTVAGLAGIAILALAAPAQAANLTIAVTGIEQTTGSLNVAVYASAETFRKQTIKAVRVPASAAKVSIDLGDLPAGDYAVMVFQDLNGNLQLDTNLLGMPKEPWGGSLQGKSVFGAPAWNDVRFALPQSGLEVGVPLFK
ncbi:MAG: DUF2141 domain-containing protein [Burkholderiaceae bacterium]